MPPVRKTTPAERPRPVPRHVKRLRNRMAWPQPSPTVNDGPIRDDDPNADLTGGHPTVAGMELDESFLDRHGLPSPGNGQPGIPRVHIGRRHGPGFPGPTPSGPTQPGVTYEGEDKVL